MVSLAILLSKDYSFESCVFVRLKFAVQAYRRTGNKIYLQILEIYDLREKSSISFPDVFLYTRWKLVLNESIWSINVPKYLYSFMGAIV